MSTIRIKSGSYRKINVKNEVFTLIKGFQVGVKGGFVTVKNEGQFPGWGDTVKVNVDKQDSIEFLSGKPSAHVDVVTE